jgi:hypothetical protein
LIYVNEGELEIETCYLVSGNSNTGLIVKHIFSDDGTKPMLSMVNNSDCDVFYFGSAAEVKDFCDFLLKIADDNWPT